jgi:hypothetical protein
MGYSRQIITLPGNQSIFVKQHDADKFNDNEREYHSRRYLLKEHAVYEWLKTTDAHRYIPRRTELSGDTTLTMDAYRKEDGWQWRVPPDESVRERYIEDALGAAESLNQLAHIPSIEHGVRNTCVSIEQEGWSVFESKEQRIREMLAEFGDDGISLANKLEELSVAARQIPARPNDSFAHHDFRQSNIAWHPVHGVRIVDWSWAGPAFEQSDTTSFLIDLAKSGVDITKYMYHINDDHALRLIGFWLSHAVDRPAPGNNNVRVQQMLSAITAFRVRNMILKTRELGEMAS